LKRFTNKEVGFSFWQRSFHDHIIRGERDYYRIAEYIENNPRNWQDDCFYAGRA
jgi:REP element-mobilizing transposase RayT